MHSMRVFKDELIRLGCFFRSSPFDDNDAAHMATLSDAKRLLQEDSQFDDAHTSTILLGVISEKESDKQSECQPLQLDCQLLPLDFSPVLPAPCLSASLAAPYLTPAPSSHQRQYIHTPKQTDKK